MVHYQTRGRENDECRGEKVRTLPGGSGNVWESHGWKMLQSMEMGFHLVTEKWEEEEVIREG